MQESIYYDERPTIRAIVREKVDVMLKYLHTYSDPTVRFDVTTWSGRCTLTPLALAIEVPGYTFQTVLNVLVQNAHIDPNASYVIDDLHQGVRIHTNALTHLLARWDPKKTEICRETVLASLIAAGADARMPALYEVTPLWGGGKIPPYELMLSSASGQSLMAFQMSQKLKVPTGFRFILDLIENHAQFTPADPPGLFVRCVLNNHNDTKWYLEKVMDFLCPPAATLEFNQIAGGLLAPGEQAHGDLLRIVQGFDPQTGMNILHLFVSMGQNLHSRYEIVERLRTLRDVYGLRLMTPTFEAKTRTVTMLAANSPRMQAAVAEVLKDELDQRHKALVVARGLSHMPALVVDEIGGHSGFLMEEARDLDKRLMDARRVQRPSDHPLPHVPALRASH